MPIHGFPGGVISSTAVTPSPTSASGVWTLDEQLQAGANWPVAPALLTNSVRTRASASAYMTRTVASNGSAQKCTWSGWVKRGSLSLTDDQWLFGSNQFVTSGSPPYLFEVVFKGAGSGAPDAITVALESNAGAGSVLTTSSVYRDPAAWYHIVVAIDTTQATASNRTLLYVNGVQVTAFSSASYVAQNTNLAINQAGNTPSIGCLLLNGSPQRFFDGYMADVNFIDGQALTPNYFGAVDAATGVWEPATYRGSYGTNGFYLPFTDRSNLAFQGNFTAGTTRLSVAANSAFDLGNAYCVEAWIRPTVTSSSHTIIGRWYGDGNDNNWVLYVSGTQLRGGVSKDFEYTTTTPTGSIVSGAWQHVAMTWDGTTKRLFVNGKVLATSTVSNAIGVSALGVFIGDNSVLNEAPFTGGISNVRVVKGSAVYTSNFTPSLNLTAITGTQLLTLQNSSIVDNSSNAFSITNTGSVTTSAPTNFAVIGSDSSGNLNNWVAANISSANNSTYDSMTDVPTLTSATASNFAVFNPLLNSTGAFSATPTYSQANLLATGTADTKQYYSESTIYFGSGKFYAEFTPSSVTATASYVGCVSEGFANFALYAPTGEYYNGSSWTAYGATYTTNDVIGVAIDATAGTIEFYKNGTAQGQKTIATGVNWVYRTSSYNTGSSHSWTANFGQRPFAYTPPTGFVALNTFNLPTPTIGATASTQANKYMDATLYTGTGSSNTIANAGLFPPALVWLKRRNAAESHGLWDTVRGGSLRLESNTTGAESNTTDRFSGITSTGFTVTSADPQTNASGSTYVGWQWRGSDSTAVTNTAGSITSTVSANTSSGFSVVTYTGTGSNATVGHGLGVAPKMIIAKSRSNAADWDVYHASLGATQVIYLNRTTAAQTNSAFWNNTAPTSTVFSLGNGTDINASGATNVAYCFSEVAGYSKFGSYTGNGSTDGTFVYTGFRPKYVMVKSSSNTENWFVWDAARNTYNATNLKLYPNLANAENGASGDTSTTNTIDFLSNGFKLRTTNSGTNASGYTYIYMAFAETPFKYSLAE